MTIEATPSKFDRVAGSGETVSGEEIDKRVTLIEDLQEEIQRLKDARREDAFTFITISILLFNVVFFSVMPTFGGPLALLIIELLVLALLAKKFGIEEAVLLISRTLDRVSSKDGGGE